MPEFEGSTIVPQEKKRNLWKTVLIAFVAALVICALWYWTSHFSSLDTKSATGSFVLSLNETITDAQGIPYSGTVQYDSASHTYSYIATEDASLVTPVGPGAFSSGTHYLAIRLGTDSNEFVVYDYATLSPVRVVRDLPIGEVVTSATWSPNGQTFAYLVM